MLKTVIQNMVWCAKNCTVRSMAWIVNSAKQAQIKSLGERNESFSFGQENLP
jgi:hypothetical protein